MRLRSRLGIGVFWLAVNTSTGVSGRNIMPIETVIQETGKSMATTSATRRPKPPFPEQKQPMPGLTAKMKPIPDHGEDSYKGSGRLKDKKVIITGGDSGIGRAVAIAFSREGADLLISYLDEHQDAKETATKNGS